MRKVDVIGTSPSSVIADVSIPTTTTAASTSATAAGIRNIKRDEKREELISTDYKEQQQYPNKEDEKEEAELVESLNKITDRSKKDIQASIAKLERRDIERIKDLCKNYNKLQKYSKLITDTDNLQKFRTALENEIGRKLSEHQLQHAAKSVKKAKLYIENVLDGKFIPHGSYGINHTKHNLEYGYLIVGLMQPGKRRTVMTTTTTKERA
jgi:exonuclease VII large subunit